MPAIDRRPAENSWYLLGYLAIHQCIEHLLHLLPQGGRQVGADKLLEVGKGGG